MGAEVTSQLTSQLISPYNNPLRAQWSTVGTYFFSSTDFNVAIVLSNLPFLSSWIEIQAKYYTRDSSLRAKYYVMGKLHYVFAYASELFWYCTRGIEYAIFYPLP